jgi:hypothetical protein
LSNLTLSGIEPLGGTDIDEAAAEAIRLAVQLQVNVELNFNGVKIHVKPNSSVFAVTEAYHDAVRRKERIAIA